jgi:hypothetical protein
LAQIPILVPLIVAGAFLGGVWQAKDLAAVWKKAVLAAALSGVLNAGYGWLLGAMKIISATGNSLAFLASCGFVAFVVVVAVYLPALGVARYRRGKSIEPEE